MADDVKALLEVQLRLQGGEPPEEAIRFLESRGMPSTEARLTIGRMVTKSIKEQRTRGVVWLVSSFVCFAVAAPFGIAVVSGLDEKGAKAKGYATSVVQAGMLPSLLLVAGLYLAYRGLRLVTSTRYAADPDR